MTNNRSKNKNKIKIIKIFIPIAILGIVGLVVFCSFLSKNSKNGEQVVNVLGLSDQGVSFLIDSGFLLPGSEIGAVPNIFNLFIPELLL